MTQTKIESINALAELERIGWTYEPIGEKEIRCVCPAHDDNTPSVNLNVEKNLWMCHAASCKAKGDIVSFIALALKVERGTVLVDLGTRYDLEDVKAINPISVEKMHAEIFQSGPLLKALRDRGVTDDMIYEARIGFFNGRITIPVYDASGNIVNIRRYLPGAPGNLKMQNTKGYGAIRLYRIADLQKNDRIWVCGGEIKALVVGHMLQPKGIGAVCATAGEGAWSSKWNSLFKDKDVWVCQDIDVAGQVASRKLAAILSKFSRSVRIIHLPLDKTRHPKGDVNDYIGAEGATVDDLLELMQKAEEWTGVKSTPTSNERAINTTIGFATSPRFVGRRIQFVANVQAVDTNPYLVPKVVGAYCDRNQPGCHSCPVSGMEMNPDDGRVELTIPAVSQGLLDMVASPKSKQAEVIRESLGIPRCKSIQMTTRDHYRIDDVRLAPQLTIASEGRNNLIQPGFTVDRQLDLNTPYVLSGVMHPHPKNQQAVFVIDDAVEAEDTLNSFDLSVMDQTELSKFQPDEWTLDGLGSKLREIYTDLETNVTRIFGRRAMHLVFDLTYHSPLLFPFDGRNIPGWVNSLIIGDSSQGKSETALRLMEHYGVGERVELKNATTAGLIGGLQQLGNRWFVSWGVIPTHDRRLVVLEEVKGAPVEVIGKLTDMRSSGIAEIPKIERRRAPARTRLAFISNPRSNRGMSSFNFGVEAMKELIGGLEDLRRFDIAIVVAASQVSAEFINERMIDRPVSEHVYTPNLCRSIVLYAWTRKPEQVQFEVDATSSCFTESIALCKKYSESLPLVDRGTMRLKLARLSASLAARTFSVHSDDPAVLVVRKCHVEYVAHLIDRIYSEEAMGYGAYSKAMTETNEVLDPNIVKRHLIATKHPRDLLRQMLYRDEISVADIEDWCEVDSDVARRLLSFLVRKHCLYRSKLSYYKTPGFIVILKQMEAEGIPEEAEPAEGDEF